MFPECCIEEWCRNMELAQHNIQSDHLFGVAAEKRAILGALGRHVYFVPCMSCVRKIAAGDMEPPKTHRCVRGNEECAALWREAETLTGYVHRILR